MQADDSARATDKVSTVALRFWLLLAVILVLAIGSSALALRFVAVPYFTAHQNQAVLEQARGAARRLDAYIERETLLLDIVASDPNVLSIALGYTSNADYFADLLASLPTSDTLSSVSFYDAIGDQVASFEKRPEASALFRPEDLERLIRQAIETPLPDRLPVALADAHGTTHFALAVPITQNDLAEGALLATYRLTLGDIFRNTETIRAPVLLTDQSIGDSGEGVELAQLNSLALTLATTPDISAVRAAGNRLIVRGITAIAVVLLGAFGVFALLGRAVIVTPHKRLEQQAHRLEVQSRDLAELAAIAERANDAILITDLDGNLTWANPSFERITGYKVEDVFGRKPGSFLQGRDTDPFTVARLSRALAARMAIKVEILNYSADGKPTWTSLSISPLKDDTGAPYGFMAISNDITEARESHEALVAAKREIEHQALHDPLTGLPNRRALEEELNRRRMVDDPAVTIVRIDLDHFKYVNDTMGHDAGDFVLKAVAQILQEETKAKDLAVRVGGDEFVLLLGHGSTEADGMTVAKRILTRIRTPKLFENKTVRVGASFGVSGLGGKLLDQDSLIIGADAALYEAKEAGRNRVHLYTPELHKTVLARRDLARELRLAVGRDELEPFFQPQFDSRTRQVVGVETLARWRSPVFGLVAPNRFLAIAEQLSLVEDIDDQIFRKAVAQVSGLRGRGITIPKLSFNVTAHRIQDRSVFEQVRVMPPDAPKIAFEVLESVLVEEQSTAFLMGLDNLRELGVQVEIDDFGSGHASIVGLMQLRPDAMKIDQRLVMPILDDPVALGVLERIVSMADLMELTVIAEGVETEAHADLLTRIGCHVLQGFHFCKPVPIKELEDFIRHETGPTEVVPAMTGSDGY